MHKKTIILFFILIQIVDEISTAPAQNDPSYLNRNNYNCEDCNSNKKDLSELKKLKNRTGKKDVFISRGWGAGGMPFSVLYMNQAYSSKAPATVDTPYKAIASLSESKNKPPNSPKALKYTAQVRNSKLSRQRNVTNRNNRIPHSSVIPQLFVSYGWGPHGK